MSSAEEAADRPEVVERLNIALVAAGSAALSKLQASTGLKKVDLVNRALAIYEFVDSETRAGNKLVLEAPDGTRQLVKLV